MYSESPLASPSIDCYEECVVTDEIYVPSTLPSTIHTQDENHTTTTNGASSDIPRNASTGKITKRSRSRPRSLKERKCSSPIVMKWLGENYETVPGSCLPRSVLYTHYQDFCKRNQMEPSSAASFGKIIRVKFPNLQTRRLGTRGQSKYHYYGLAIKETSIYYRSVYSKEGLTRFSGASLKRESSQVYNPTSKTGILLPEFPKANTLNFAKPFPVEKVETFLMMYRAHCQRILDSVVRANFHEVQDFLIHFWQGMPTHMLPILSCQAAVDLVVVCDFILYRTLCEVLIPANLQPLPDNLLDEVIAFSHNMVEWLFAALQDLPAALGIRKVQTAEMFGKSLRRQTALVQLAKGARAVLRNSETVSSILDEWRAIDFNQVSNQAAFGQYSPDKAIELLREFPNELEQLFVKQSSLEVYFEWLDSLIERRVEEPAQRGVCSLPELTQEFLVTWNCFYSAVEKEIRHKEGKCFDAYRAVHLVLDEYVNYVMELLHTRVIEKQYNDVLKVQGNSDSEFNGPRPDLALPTPLLPPTPDHTPASCSENRIVAELQEPNGSFFPICSSLQSPGFMTFTDAFCDNFFKQELAHQNQYLGGPVPTVLPLDNATTHNSPFSDNIANTPLTPLSLQYSSSSPLSHASQPSPDPSVDLEYNRPHSQGSFHGIDSPPQAAGDIAAHIPGNYGAAVYNHSNVSSTCTSPLSSHHSSLSPNGGGLGIAASLELVAEGSCSSLSGFELGASAYSYSHLPQGAAAQAAEYGNPGNSYSHYEIDSELLQLAMVSPDELLSDPFCSTIKEHKPSPSQMSSPAPPTPIH